MFTIHHISLHVEGHSHQFKCPIVNVSQCETQLQIFMNLSSQGHANISGPAVLTEPMSRKTGISEKLWSPQFPLYTTYFGCVRLLIFNIFHSTQPYPDLYHCLNLAFWAAAPFCLKKKMRKLLHFVKLW